MRSSSIAHPRAAPSQSAAETTAAISCVTSERTIRESWSGAAWHTQKAPSPAKPKTSVSGRPNANASAQSKGPASASCVEISVPTSPQATR